ncbi:MULTISPECIES: glycosyltransferase family 2 protein [Hyphomonas]|uniref:Glycosyltransferase n=2 Tax=Hyphomonas adhaerens TaxID=81029 RepID=A0A3B9GTQ8_9PROT|nr:MULTISPECIES: glycosyltransferase family 2 protein [Hyphomonas]MBB41250.1 glycosyltransferase [Hyphomonas sp.]HAE25748.1 glycosyltransferase [Hyphomonas adhaerens]
MGGMGFSGDIGRAQARAPLRCPRPDIRLALESAHRLDRQAPGLSARQTFSPGQRATVTGLLKFLGLMALLVPELPGLLVMLLVPPVFVAIILFRLFLLAVALRLNREDPQDDGAATPLLPVYTVLVALKDETAVVPQLAQALSALDYPQDRIDLKLLVEEADVRTQTAVRGQSWPNGAELLIVPAGQPQTKPRALNYGLDSARGTYVVVYDAEDRPHPSQLKSAVRAFNAHGTELACVQAPLVGVPAKGGWLARQWAQEYAIQFSLLVPALARLGLPVALGGTSNHFRRTSLVAAGGWDAWNVTEDADLGLRLARLGHRVGAIRSPTLEAPPERGRDWRAQRSRWLKGYMQTWCVLMRGDGEVPGLASAAFLSVQMTLGAAILSAMVHGPWAVWCAACLCLPGLSLGVFGLSALCLSLFTGVVSASVAPGRWNWHRVFVILTLPLYWPLQTLAMVRALWSLSRTPHYWAKTPHI